MSNWHWTSDNDKPLEPIKLRNGWHKSDRNNEWLSYLTIFSILFLFFVIFCLRFFSN